MTARSGERFRSRHRLQQRGLALITLLLLSAIVAVICTAVVARFQVQFGNATNKERSLRAEYGARAGLQFALAELSENSTYEGTLKKTPSSSTEVGYDVTIVNNWLSDTPLAANTKGTHPEVPPHQVWLQSWGVVGEERLEALGATAQAFVSKAPSVFGDLWHQTDTAVVFSPGESLYLDSLTIANTGSTTSIRADKGVDLRGTIFEGDVIVPGDEAPFFYDVGGGSDIRKKIDPSQQIPMRFRRPKKYPKAPPQNKSFIAGGNVPEDSYFHIGALDNQTIELASGVYHVESTFHMKRNSTLVVKPNSANDPVVVYVGNRLIFGEGVKVNIDGDPRLLQFYTTDEGCDWSSVYFESDAQVHAIIAGESTRVFSAGTNIRFRGAIRCASSEAVNTLDGIPRPDSTVTLEYDPSLAGDVIEDCKPEWVLIDEYKDQ